MQDEESYNPWLIRVIEQVHISIMTNMSYFSLVGSILFSKKVPWSFGYWAIYVPHIHRQVQALGSGHINAAIMLRFALCVKTPDLAWRKACRKTPKNRVGVALVTFFLRLVNDISDSTQVEFDLFIEAFCSKWIFLRQQLVERVKEITTTFLIHAISGWESWM